MGFDLEAYTHATARVDVGDAEFEAFADRPLSREALRCLHYMADVETHTVCYLRDLLVTPSHQDPAITAILTMWAYEEFWHGEVIERILAVHGEETGPGRIRRVRVAQGVRNVVTPIGQCLAAAIVGEAFIATHMAWGALNEWSTHAAYARLAAREDHPVLSTVLARIMRQETRHIAFYRSEAARRLRASSRARRVTRSALRRFWAPVGSTVMPGAETAFLLRYLFGGEAGARAVAAIDQKLDRLPGLAGLRLVRRAVDGYGVGPVTHAQRRETRIPGHGERSDPAAPHRARSLGDTRRPAQAGGTR